MSVMKSSSFSQLFNISDTFYSDTVLKCGKTLPGRQTIWYIVYHITFVIMVKYSYYLQLNNYRHKTAYLSFLVSEYISSNQLNS